MTGLDMAAMADYLVPPASQTVLPDPATTVDMANEGGDEDGGTSGELPVLLIREPGKCFLCQYDFEQQKMTLRSPKVITPDGTLEPSVPSLEAGKTYSCVVKRKNGGYTATISDSSTSDSDAVVTVPICRLYTGDGGELEVEQLHVGAIVLAGGGAKPDDKSLEETSDSSSSGSTLQIKGFDTATAPSEQLRDALGLGGFTLVSADTSDKTSNWTESTCGDTLVARVGRPGTDVEYYEVKTAKIAAVKVRYLRDVALSVKTEGDDVKLVLKKKWRVRKVLADADDFGSSDSSSSSSASGLSMHEVTYVDSVSYADHKLKQHKVTLKNLCIAGTDASETSSSESVFTAVPVCGG